MTENRPLVPSLIEQSIQGVRGWLASVDVELFCLFHALTTASECRGLVEIGVYEGRSAIVLGHLLLPSETLTVIDPFGMTAMEEIVRKEQNEWYADLSRETFEQNYLKAHGSIPTIVQAFSTELKATDVAKQARMIHVDGAHDLETVSSDVSLAEELGGTDCVVVFDDFGNPRTPGVTAAVWQAVTQGRLVPLVLTNKLWMCKPEVADRYRMRLAGVFQTSGWGGTVTQTMEGHTVWLAARTPPITPHWKTVLGDLTPPILARAIGRARRSFRVSAGDRS